MGGPILTPDLDAVDGTLTPVPGTEYVLAVNGVTLQAPIVAQRENAVLYRIGGGPVQLKEALVGRESDGWMVGSSDDPVAHASYTRYDVSDDEPGLAVIRLTRLGWCPDPGARTTGKVTVRIGPVGIGPDKQPRIEKVTETRRFDIPDCEANGATLSPPNVPWRMEITVAPTFIPAESRCVEERSPPARRRRRPRGLPALVRRLARRCDEVGEAHAQREARERAALLERLCGGEHRAGKRDGLRDEERPQRDRAEPRGVEVGNNVVESVLARVEIEDELLLRVRRARARRTRGGRARSRSRERRSSPPPVPAGGTR